MLKIFRKLRQKLLAEGSFKKYLVYAVGEILLVMIGILLALQVNNWNNIKKDRAIGDNYLHELKEASEQDLQRLEGFIKNTQQYIAKAESNYLSKRQETGHEITKQDLDKIGILRQTFFVSEETYQEIISNGHLSLLPDQVKTKLLDLHTRFRAINRIDDKMAATVNAQHLKMGEFFEIIRLAETSQYEIRPGDQGNEDLALLTYKNYINITYDWMKTQSFFYNQLKEKYINLIEAIEENKP